MPDLKSELKKLEGLKFDDDGEPQQEVTMQETNNPYGVSHTFFNVLKANPGCTRARLLDIAQAAGVGQSSSSSLLTQFKTRGLLRSVDSPNGLTFFAIGDEYKPGYVKPKRKLTKTRPVKVATPTPVAVVPKQETNVSELLSNMSILKARALYDELKQIFGS